MQAEIIIVTIRFPEDVFYHTITRCENTSGNWHLPEFKPSQTVGNSVPQNICTMFSCNQFL